MIPEGYEVPTFAIPALSLETSYLRMNGWSEECPEVKTFILSKEHESMILKRICFPLRSFQVNLSLVRVRKNPFLLFKGIPEL